MAGVVWADFRMASQPKSVGLVRGSAATEHCSIFTTWTTWTLATWTLSQYFIIIITINTIQGDHSPDNIKFSDNSMTFPGWFAALLPMLSVTHITPVLVLLSVVGVGMQQCMIRNQNEMHKLSKVKNVCRCAANNKQFRPLFPDKVFPWHFHDF